jgi:hypothetical protein
MILPEIDLFIPSYFTEYYVEGGYAPYFNRTFAYEIPTVHVLLWDILL